MKNITIAGLIATPLLVFALAMPSLAADSATTTCKDGTTTTSTGKGTCSGHGGVQKAAPAAAAAPAAKTPAAPKTATPAAGATTTCADGTTSTSSGKGTCSGHGGVQKAAKSKAATAATTAAPAAAAKTAATAPARIVCGGTGRRAGCSLGHRRQDFTATKSAPTATAGNTDPTGATAKCKDGTYSKSAHRSGTCSSHGGVAEWLTAAQ